jgi:hypothetical protein
MLDWVVVWWIRREKDYNDFVNPGIFFQTFLIMETCSWFLPSAKTRYARRYLPVSIIHDNNVALTRFRKQEIAKPIFKFFWCCRTGIAVFTQNMSVAIPRDNIHASVFPPRYKAVDSFPTQWAGVLTMTILRNTALVYVDTPWHRNFGYLIGIFGTRGFRAFFVV